jgi:hypothetical protein
MAAAATIKTRIAASKGFLNFLFIASFVGLKIGRDSLLRASQSAEPVKKPVEPGKEGQPCCKN